MNLALRIFYTIAFAGLAGVWIHPIAALTISTAAMCASFILMIWQ